MSVVENQCESALPMRVRLMMMPHPAVLIFLWGCVTVALQSLQSGALLLAGVPLLLAACAFSPSRLFTLLRRTRWIMLSLLFIYAYATPGTAVWAALAQFSPTHEGLIDGLMQLSRLAFALAGLAILLSLLSQQQLIGGLYTLAYPLRYFGLSRERIAVRLALTLYYAETAMLDSKADWRSKIKQMLAARESPLVSGSHAERVSQDSIELHAAPLTPRDALLLVAGFALLLLVWL